MRLEKKTVLSQVSFSVSKGEIAGLLGPNGAGKSTFFKIVSQALRPESGKIFFQGNDLRIFGADAKKSIAMVPQENAFFEELSVQENMDYFAAQLGIPTPKQKTSELIQLLGLEPYRKKNANQLSGGYQKMLNLAIALLQDPKILVLDEPTVGLDPINRSRVWEKIRSIQASGTTILISTHYMEEAHALCDTVCLFHEGKIVAFDSPETLIQKFAQGYTVIITLSKPVSPEVIALMGKEIPKTGILAKGTSIILSLPEKNFKKIELAKMALQLNGHEIIKIRIKEPDLEQVFINLTGNDLRNFG